MAKQYIIEDSENQKNNNSTEISKVEDEFINDYSITAANLLEMNPDFAEGLTSIFEDIYKDYPEVEGYLTNITLWHTDFSEKNIIAAYQCCFPFVSLRTSNGWESITKMSVFLSDRYFLNEDKLIKDVKYSEQQGWFPENCTQYSSVAHELGHYISFIVTMKEYDVDSTLIINEDNQDKISELLADHTEGKTSLSIIEEAYENYKNDVGTDEDIDTWRGHISGYALQKDNEGDYIYDETIAEAFHDVYLNGENAAEPSQYIVEVLKERLKN